MNQWQYLPIRTTWQLPVATAGDLSANDPIGTVRLVLDTGTLYFVGTDGIWHSIGGGSSITVSDTNSVDLSLVLGVLSAAVKLSAASAGAGYLNASLSIETDGLHVQVPLASDIAAGVVSLGTQSFTGNKTFKNSVTIEGNLTILGSHATIDSVRILAKDKKLTLNSAETSSGASEYPGMEIDRGTSRDASIVWDESDDSWKTALTSTDLVLSSVVGTFQVGEYISNSQTPPDSARIKSIVGTTVTVGMRAGALITTEAIFGELSGAVAVVDTITDNNTYTALGGGGASLTDTQIAAINSAILDLF